MNKMETSYGVHTSYSNINEAITASVVGHAVAFVLIIFGIPMAANKPDIILRPVPVEVISSAELSEKTNVPPANEEAQEPPPVKKQLPKMTAEAPPSPQEKIEETLPPEPVPPPPSEIKPEVIEERPPIKNVKPAPVPPQKPDVPQRTVQKQNENIAKDQKSLDSVLKNLVTQEDPVSQPLEKIESAAGQSSDVFAENKLSVSEIDAVRAQISKCWNFNIGAKYAEDLVVQLRLVMRPDGTVQSAKIVDQGRANRDDAYRAAADSALRAVNNPRCSPLDLPPDKYDRWKTITLNFDPSLML